jgi:hypothetical protein
MINITNMTVQILDIGEKSMSCLHNGMLNDKCMYDILCKPLSHYFIYTGAALLCLEVLVAIFLYFFKKHCAANHEKFFYIAYKCESMLKFAFMIYCIAVIYYSV